jgi:hypothetical protein
VRLLSRFAETGRGELMARERVEYVGGPWAGADGELERLPDELVAPDGRYVRSVRCADDGAMRYLWRPPDPMEPKLEHEEGAA